MRIQTHLLALTAYACLYLVCEFGFLASFANAQAPHKFVNREDRKQEIHNIALLRFKTPGKAIPIVATAEQKEITLFWWDYRLTDEAGNPRLPKWKFVPLQHQVNKMYSPYGFDPTRWSWSRQIQLVAVNSTVLLIAKRQSLNQNNSRLLIYSFKWNASAGELVPDQASPFSVPLNNMGISRTGDELWAGYDLVNKKLSLLTQAVFTAPDPGESAHGLALLEADLSGLSPQLDNQAIWKRKRVGDGGYDFHAIEEGGKLHIVYREYHAAWEYHIENIFIDLPLDLSLNQDEIYKPLTYKIIDLNSATTLTHLPNIPGGEHPRIQNLDPLYVSYNRIEKGNIGFDAVLHGPMPWPPIPPTYPADHITVTIKPQVERLKIVLLRYDMPQNEWKRGRVLSFRTPRIARPASFDYPYGAHVYLTNFDRINSGAIISGLMKLMTRHDIYPVWMTSDSPKPSTVAGEKASEIDLVYHTSFPGTLRIKRFLVLELSSGGEQLGFRSLGRAELDINHEQIQSVTMHLHPYSWAENGQFTPWVVQENFLLSAGTKIEQPRIKLDNTIGTSIVLDKSTPDLSFFAYTDAGDGGLRVIFSEKGLQPGLRPPSESKEFDPSTVSGPGLAEEQWVSVRESELDVSGHPGLPAALPDTSKTIPNERGPTFDLLLDVVPGQPPPEPGNTIDIDPTAAQAVESVLETLSPPLSISSTNFAGLRAAWRMTPGVAFANRQLTFDASGSVEPASAYTIQQYLWEFWDGENTETAEGAQVVHQFAAPGRYRVKLTIVSSNPNELANNQVAQTYVSVRNRLFDEVFETHTLVNTNLQDAMPTWMPTKIGNMDVAFSRYKLGYRHTSSGARKLVQVKIREHHDEFWNFLASPQGQGRIHYGFLMGFRSTDIAMGGLIGDILEVDEARASWKYTRPFTPSILMREVRGARELVSGKRAAVLTMKPVGDAWIKAVDVDVDISPKGLLGWFLVDAVILVLVAAGLLALLGVINAFIAFIAWLVTQWPWGPIVALIVFIALIAFIHTVVFGIVEYYVIEAQIKESIEDTEFRDRLDDSGILTHAGEGLAEIIAMKALKKRNDQVSPSLVIELPPGVNWGRARHIDQIWQQIFVTHDEVKLLVR